MNETLWIAVLVALTMGLTRLAKLWPRLPKGLVPLLAVAIGAGLYLAYAVYVVGQPLADAWQSWLVVLVGAGAVVGHDLLKPALSELVGESMATILLGRIPGSAEASASPPKPPTSTIFVAILLGGLLGGCAQLGALAQAALGSSLVGTIMDTARSGVAAYLVRHPDRDREAALTAAAADVLEANLAYARSATPETRADVLSAYRSYLALLAEYGIDRAIPPPGGAEGNAPSPVPLLLPTVAEVDARL